MSTVINIPVWSYYPYSIHCLLAYIKFSNVSEPIRFLSNLCDFSTFVEYNKLKEAKVGTINEITDIKGIVTNLADVIIARKPLSTIRIDTLSRGFSGKERGEMGSTVTSVNLYAEKIRLESK